MLAALLANALGMCAQNVVYRTGTAIDQQAIAAAVLRESMNPLFLQPERFVVASDAADEHAKAGLELHEQPTQGEAAEVKRLTCHALVVCRTISATLLHWPRLERSEDRRPRPEARGAAK